MRGRGGPITAAVDVPGDQFWRGTIDGVTGVLCGKVFVYKVASVNVSISPESTR